MNLNQIHVSLTDLSPSEMQEITGGDAVKDVVKDVGHAIGYFFGYLFVAGPRIVRDII